MSKLYSLEDYMAHLNDTTDFELSKISAYAEFDTWVESVNPHMLHDEEKFLEWFYSLQEEDYWDFVERLWKNCKLDDEIEQAQERDFIGNLELDKGEMLLEQLEEYTHVPI